MDTTGNYWDCIEGVAGASSFTGLATTGDTTSPSGAHLRAPDTLVTGPLYPLTADLAATGCPSSTVLYAFESNTIPKQQGFEDWTIWFE
jgi:hypothetical protein